MNSSSSSKSLNSSVDTRLLPRLPGSACPPTTAPSSTLPWAAPVCVQPVRSLPLKSGRHAIGDCADSASDKLASTRDFMGRILFRVVRRYRTNEENMADLSRREFLRTTATSALVTSVLAAREAQLRANPLGLPIGSQT